MNFLQSWYDPLVMEVLTQPVRKPNLITGEGRMKGRGLDVPPKYQKKKKRRAAKLARQSRKRNRAK